MSDPGQADDDATVQFGAALPAVGKREIEITEKMIEAGLAALHRSGAVDYETPPNAYVVRDVLTAVL